MWHSEGHLAVLFYIFFHHKKKWRSCVSSGALAIFSNESTARGYSSSFTELLPRAVQKLSVYQLPMGVKCKKAKRDREKRTLYNWFWVKSKAAVKVIFKLKFKEEFIYRWSWSIVMIQESFCMFPNPSTNPRCAVSKQHAVWHWHNVLRQGQRFDWPLHFCLQWKRSSVWAQGGLTTVTIRLLGLLCQSSGGRTIRRSPPPTEEIAIKATNTNEFKWGFLLLAEGCGDQWKILNSVRLIKFE